MSDQNLCVSLSEGISTYSRWIIFWAYVAQEILDIAFLSKLWTEWFGISF
jgi:hypothetical protein